MDYRDHRPSLNALLLRLLTSGVGLRQSSRFLGLSRRCTELKFHKIARQLRRLDLNLRRPLPAGSSLQFDEIETYEGRRNTRPLSIPILIEKETRYMIWAEAAPIRPHGKMSKARKKAVLEDERRYGPRKNLSARSVERTLRRGVELTEGLAQVELFTDRKSTYPSVAKRLFGEDRLVHHTTDSKLARKTWNPLFAINHTEAMTRDLMARLRRESWLVSKKRRYLDLCLAVWASWRNYARLRFNRDKESPAQMLGFVDRRMTEEQLLSWRQDWRKQSIHPLARGSQSVQQYQARRRAA